MLADMADKRRAEEEEAYKLYMKAEKRRKRFKEALLEKALRAREETNGDPSIPAGGATKAYLLQKVARRANEPLSEEEVQQQESAKKEKLVAMRRKFKEQYKSVLENLMVKNQLKESEEKEKSRTLPKRLVAKKSSPSFEDDANMSSLPVGSALSVVRRREESSTVNDQATESPTTHPPDGRAANTATTSATTARPNDERDEFIDEDGLPLTEQELAEQKTRRLANKMQQLKIAAYLSTLAEQKKAEENKKALLEVLRPWSFVIYFAYLYSFIMSTRPLSISNGQRSELQYWLRGSSTRRQRGS